MLKILRNKKTAKKIWIGLAIIIIPAFCFWGFGSSSRDRQETASVGRIFGRNVSNLEFKNALAAVRTMAIMQFGDKLSEIEKYLNFEGQAWERLILLHEAEKRHLRAKDSEVIDEIQGAPYFQDKTGAFNNKIYQETLRYVLRLQPRAFEEQTRQNLIISKLYDQLTQNVKLNDDLIRQEYLKANQELSIYYIAALFSDFAKNIQPGEKEIGDYFQNNKAMFKQPPVKNLPPRIPELAEIKDKVKAALIEETAKKTAKAMIDQCAEKLKQMDFGQAASSCGLRSTGTDFFKSTAMLEPLGPARRFWESAKNLKNNQPSEVIANEKGYYIVRLRSVKPIDEEKFIKEKESFSKRLLNSKKNELFAAFTEQLKKKAQ